MRIKNFWNKKIQKKKNQKEHCVKKPHAISFLNNLCHSMKQAQEVKLSGKCRSKISLHYISISLLLNTLHHKTKLILK